MLEQTSSSYGGLNLGLFVTKRVLFAPFGKSSQIYIYINMYMCVYICVQVMCHVLNRHVHINVYNLMTLINQKRYLDCRIQHLSNHTYVLCHLSVKQNLL